MELSFSACLAILLKQIEDCIIWLHANCNFRERLWPKTDPHLFKICITNQDEHYCFIEIKSKKQKKRGREREREQKKEID